MPSKDEIRIVKKFLLFPKSIMYNNSYELRWLEVASFIQQYEFTRDGSCWVDVCWADCRKEQTNEDRKILFRNF